MQQGAKKKLRNFGSHWIYLYNIYIYQNVAFPCLPQIGSQIRAHVHSLLLLAQLQLPVWISWSYQPLK